MYAMGSPNRCQAKLKRCVYCRLELLRAVSLPSQNSPDKADKVKPSTEILGISGSFFVKVSTAVR